MFFIALLTGYLVYVTTWIMFGEKLAAVYPQGLLMDIVKKVNVALFIRMLILTPFVVLIGLIVSNRVAGPVYRIKAHLTRLYGRDYSRDMKLRKKDEFHDLAGELNRLTQRLREDSALREDFLRELRQKLESIKPAGPDQSRELEDILSIINRIENIN
jgi:signal transduction histidine kinase